MSMDDIYSKIIDGFNNMKIIDNISNKINSGDVYCLNLSTSATAGSTVLLYIKTPNTTVRQSLVAQINSSIANPTVYFSNGTIAAASSYTTVTAYNMNFASTKTTTMIFGTMATSSGFSTYGGTKYEQYQAQAPAYIGTVLNGAAQYGWNLAQNTGYVIGVTCASTSGVNVNIKLVEM
jgi:hypothetical protein